MQNIWQTGKSLHTQDKNMQRKKFFCEYFGVVFTRFYIFINISGTKGVKTPLGCVRF